MGIEIKKRYLRLVRRAHRFLRSPKLRRHPWIRKIIHPIFDRELWHPCRDTVSAGQVRSVMDHGTRRPATGVIVFNWGSLRKQMDKVDKEVAKYIKESAEAALAAPSPALSELLTDVYSSEY